MKFDEDELANERELVEAAQADAEAFAALYDRYVERIHGYAYRRTSDVQSAEDITAATFERALRHLPRYRWQGVGFGAWLYRIAHNEITSRRRRQAVWQRVRVTLSLAQPDAVDVEWLVQQNERGEQLRAALATLPARDQDVLLLRFFEELTSEETAAVLGCSVDNVYVRLHRALQRLKQRYEALADFAEEQTAESTEEPYEWKQRTSNA